MLVVLGILLGVAGGLASAGLLRTFLFGIAPDDAPTFAAIAAGVLVIGLIAAWLPARRATRVDPAAALRVDG